jgi:hypothetical protein
MQQPQHPDSVTLTDRLREAAVVRGEQFLAEIPATLLRLRLFLLVLTVSAPAFLLGWLALLAWHLLG